MKDETTLVLASLLEAISPVTDGIQQLTSGFKGIDLNM